MATNRVLILGGRGRIGSSVALDLLRHTNASIIITGKTDNGEWSQLPLDSRMTAERIQTMTLDLSERDRLTKAIAHSTLVIHCAGPFHYRNEDVLDRCIQQGVNYLDVSDNVGFTRKVLSRSAAAEQAGITAIVNTGIFPGISNSMVRQGVEHFDQPAEIHLSYVVSGSGGAGLTVMRTTFLGLMQPFSAWVGGRWRLTEPYSDRQSISLPPPYGTAHVYWYEMPETLTLAETFPVHTVITKFGSIPDFYNHLTWIAAHVFPKAWIQNPTGTEFLSRVSYLMTNVTDRASGIGVGIRAEVIGQKDGKTRRYCSTLVHDNTAIAAGYGTGSIAQLILAGQLHKPGVWVVEQALPTELFEQVMGDRGLTIQQQWDK